MAQPDGPHVILVAGGTGAGKTSIARSLERGLGAMRFSIDDWMTALFWMDSPQPIRFDWTMERIDRCEAMIWPLAERAVALGRCAILDLGFTLESHRAAFAGRAAAAGIPVALHHVDVPADERWRRVEQRNAERGETYAMQVDRAMFDAMESMWEAPTAEEMTRLNGIHHRWSDSLPGLSRPQAGAA